MYLSDLSCALTMITNPLIKLLVIIGRSEISSIYPEIDLTNDTSAIIAAEKYMPVHTDVVPLCVWQTVNRPYNVGTTSLT